MDVEEVESFESKKRLLDDSTDATDIVQKRSNLKRTKEREITTVIVRNLPSKYNFYKVKKYFSQCGKVCYVEMQDDPDTQNKLARVEFETHDEALSALTRTYKRIGPNEITVDLLQDSTVWITNFPPFYDSKNLRDLFNQVGGTTLSVRLPSLKYDSNRRFAYIDMASPEQASNAIRKLHGYNVDGFELVVKKSDPFQVSKRTDAATLERREVFIRNLDFSTDPSQKLQELFSKYGTIEKIVVPAQRDSEKEDGHKILNKGIAFVHFSCPDSAKRALELNNYEIEGRPISVSLADRKAYLERQEVKNLLLHGNQDHVVSIFPISDKTTKVQIETLITERAHIESEAIRSIYLVADHEGALIVLKDVPTAAKVSLAVNGILYDKKKLSCAGVEDIKRHSVGQDSKKISIEQQTSTRQKNLMHNERPGVQTDKKMTNEDFRRMLFGK